MNIHFALALLLSVLQITLAVDYCDKELCYNGGHIGCKNNGQFKCKGAKLLNMKKFKHLIVDAHNKYRNEVALGKVKGISSAKRMATMTWDSELAKLAELNVKTCEFNHDKCRNTKKFKYSGQNLAMWVNTDKNPDYKSIVTDGVKMWFEEWKDTSMDEIRAYGPPKDSSKMNGHFTVMSADRNFKVGCAAAKIDQPKMQGKWENWKYLMACNYATTNMMEKPIFEEGPSASDCKTGKNPKYPGLCSVKEKYPSVNDFYVPYGK